MTSQADGPVLATEALLFTFATALRELKSQFPPLRCSQTDAPYSLIIGLFWNVPSRVANTWLGTSWLVTESESTWGVQGPPRQYKDPRGVGAALALSVTLEEASRRPAPASLHGRQILQDLSRVVWKQRWDWPYVLEGAHWLLHAKCIEGARLESKSPVSGFWCGSRQG